MSHAGNIRGPRGKAVGHSPTRASDTPGHAGRAESPRADAAREEKTGIWNLVQDGLETGGEPRTGRAREGKSGVFESPRPTGSRPALGRAPEGAEEGTRFDARPSVSTPRAPEGPPAQVPPTPLEDLLPEFPEPIGQESLAHHFAEELRYLGADLRPSRLPPSTRAERLWSFFLAYAEANAKDPQGQTGTGRELFRQALTENGFSQLRDANSGLDGTQVALWLLEAHSPEELREQLAEVRLVPEPRPSEVSPLPVSEHPTASELPEPRDSHSSPVPERPAQPHEARKDSPLPALQTGGVPQGMGVPAPVPPGARGGQETHPEQVPASGPSQRGTNRRLGSHMFWNVLHRFRDAPEEGAVARERWNQLAFGALFAFVGAALLVALLASL